VQLAQQQQQQAGLARSIQQDSLLSTDSLCVDYVQVVEIITRRFQQNRCADTMGSYAD
jgi:hypothetical protein